MDEEMKELKESDRADKLRKILTDFAKNIKKGELEHFTTCIDPALEGFDKLVEKTDKENTSLKNENYKNKLAIIAFNGVIIAVMVNSADKVHYNPLSFILLSVSISIGVLSVIFHYLKSECDNVDAMVAISKFKEILKFCKSHKESEDVVNDTKFFIRNELLQDQKKFESVPELLADFNKKNKPLKKFIIILAFELLFYIPFALGFALTMHQLIGYISAH